MTVPKQPIHIVGMYKCGTSWLLAALSAHPAAVGLREFDIVRASLAPHDQGGLMLEAGDRERRYFSGHPYCRMTPDELSGFTGQSGSPEIPERFALGKRSPNLSKPLSFRDVPDQRKLEFHQQLLGAKSARALVGDFLEMNGSLAPEATHLILKSADQVAVHRSVERLCPDTKKVLIVRDGRDAAISAVHFRKIMRKENAPWAKGEAGFSELLKGWVNRAQMVERLRADTRLYVLRYEDLTRDFGETLAPLLEWLGLDAAPGLVEQIEAATSFEAVTGRKRGEAADAVVRKGAIGEWADVLDHEEQEAAWNLAGEQLAAFGYTRTGAYDSLDSQERSAV